MRPSTLSGLYPSPEASSLPTIKAALDQVILAEAHRNERRLADVRAVVILISTGLDVLVFFFPQPLIAQDHVPPTIALVGMVASLISLGIVRLLRQPPSPRQLRRLQVMIPLFDSLLLGAFTANIWRVFGDVKPMIIANIAAFCCLIAVSGGMRLNRRSSVLTTLLALANFAWAAVLFRLDLAIALFAAFTIFGTGYVGMWMATIVRRQVKNESGRLLMARFLPRTVVDAAFESPLELLQQPQKREVTIVVTDLRGFTHFAEPLDPQAVLDFLNHYQGLLACIVEQHGGWVDKFMGDGMLAVFGAPEPLENHADQALQAAVSMLKAMQQVSPLAMGIGIHSGPVVTGCLGTGNRLEFTVIGDTVNVAARIEALTKQIHHPLLISETTWKTLNHWPLESVGQQVIRGRLERLELFTLAAGVEWLPQ